METNSNSVTNSVTSLLSVEKTKNYVFSQWEKSVIPTLQKYIEIPNQSPEFDKDWEKNGYTESAVNLIKDWVISQNVSGLSLEVIKEAKRTPLIFITVDATAHGNMQKTVLMYGHMDKQPPLDEKDWLEGLHPYKPVIRDGKLYGRGGADDGYAVFAAITSIQALKNQSIPHSRIVLVVEACEESGSKDLPFYMEKLKSRIGTPSLVVCLDSGCGNYEQFFTTTSLRGIAMGDLTIRVLKEGVHSGHASGIAASSFRILRNILDRIEDPLTGKFKIPEFNCVVPPNRLEETRISAKFLGDEVWKELPWVDGSHPISDNVEELLLNRAWSPTLSITGAAGLPPYETAGNVLRPFTTVRVSCRVPPTVDAQIALEALKKTITDNPPREAKIEFINAVAAAGWEAPTTEPWLQQAMDDASKTFYNGKPAVAIGEGGSIPFMKMLHDKFPAAQFVITGVLGPQSNAHGPNEFIHLDYAKRLTCCIVAILAKATKDASIPKVTVAHSNNQHQHHQHQHDTADKGCCN